MNESIKYHSVTGKDNDQFVGIKMIDGVLNVYCPETYRLPNEEKSKKKEVYKLLRILTIIGKKYPDISLIDRGRKDKLYNAFESNIWLIEDFLSHGVFHIREKVHSTDGRGKIDWKRTLAQLPLVSNQNIVYEKLINYNTFQIDSVITDIYKYCLTISSDIVGWLFGFHYETKVTSFLSQGYMVSIINTALANTYLDAKKQLYHHLLNILEGVQDNQMRFRTFEVGVSSFHVIWEIMIDAVFGNVADKSAYYPNSVFEDTQKRSHKMPSLRPDTIIDLPDKFTIIDAKYYRYSSTIDWRDLPDSTSVHKQVLYADYLKRKLDVINQVDSVFLLPMDKVRSNIFVNFNFIGRFKTLETSISENDYTVYVILVDTHYICQLYINSETEAAQDLLDYIASFKNQISKS